MLDIVRPFVYSPRRYATLVEFLMSEGKESGPRGMKTVEIIDAHLILRDIRDRIIFNAARKMNIGFAIADWLQIMAGDDELDMLTHFASGMSEFADPDNPEKVGGAYGPRLIRPEISQIEGVIKRLEEDPDSRQAVMSIYDGSLDLRAEAHVVPCTLSLQFLVRGGKLHLIATMRSNDIVWGLTYDVFNFTMMQEYVAARLGLDVGDYRHHAGSLHLYVDRDKDLVKQLGDMPRVNMKMPQMPKTIDIQLLYGLFKYARDLTDRIFWQELEALSSQYEKDLALVARFWAARKAGEKYEAKASYDATKGKAIRKMLRHWSI